MKKMIFGLGALALILGVVGISAGTSSAYRGDASMDCPNHQTERHESMEEALENKDYEAWKNLMEDKGRVTQLINEDNFAKFAEVHELMEEGKTDEAQEIRKELGLGMMGGHGRGVDDTGQFAGHRGMGRSMNR